MNASWLFTTLIAQAVINALVHADHRGQGGWSPALARMAAGAAMATQTWPHGTKASLDIFWLKDDSLYFFEESPYQPSTGTDCKPMMPSCMAFSSSMD